MTDNTRKPDDKPEPVREPNDEPVPMETGQDEDGDARRRKAAAALLNPAIEPAAAGAMVDADPRLDDRSETERALERATRTPD